MARSKSNKRVKSNKSRISKSSKHRASSKGGSKSVRGAAKTKQKKKTKSLKKVSSSSKKSRVKKAKSSSTSKRGKSSNAKKTSAKKTFRSTSKSVKSKSAEKKNKRQVSQKKAKAARKPKHVEEDEEIKIVKVESDSDDEATGEVQRIVIDLSDDEEVSKNDEETNVSTDEVQGTVEETVMGENSGELSRNGAGNAVEPGKPRCPECGSTNLRWDYERAELVCLDCGAIIEESMIDFGPEWRAFDSYQKTKRQRTGSPIKYTKPNKGLVTEIDKYNRDIRGTKLSPQAASQMGRLRKWHKRSSIASSIERNLTIAMGDLERISSYLGLPANIREAAALLYRKAVEKGLIRGRLIESVVAAVIYMICRQYGIPRTLDEISEVSGISKKEIGRTYRFLKKELYVDVPLTNPIHYVPRFASALGLSGKVQEKAKEILNEAVSKGLISGRGPTGVAAAAVYIASVMMGERRTQKEVAEVAGVTEVTIRNRYRELKRELNIDIDEE